MVCGGGGVGKTTIAASIAIAGARVRKRVLVVTIDPAKRLLQAFGFENAYLQEGGEPMALSPEVKAKLGLQDEAKLSVAVLNPKYVLKQILEQTLTPEQGARLSRTVLFTELSQMVYGLQEYTAYEWVTRMIQNNEFDLIVLDTPPAVHAKDFFGAPDKIKNLMESRVFQLFTHKKNWFESMLSFNWLERLLGHSVFGDSRVFFETFSALRLRILERCELLSKFFRNDQVSVVAVSTLDSSAGLELQGLTQFLTSKAIQVETLIVNQVEVAPREEQKDPREALLPPSLREKLEVLRRYQESLAERDERRLNEFKKQGTSSELIPIAMNYAHDGFEVLRMSSFQLE